VTLVCFALLLASAIIAGKLLGLVERPDGSTSIDNSITSWAVAHRTDGLTTVAKALSTVGSQKLLLPVTLITAALIVARRRLVLAGALVLMWGGAIGLYSFTKYFVHRQRPPEEIWLTKVAGTAFPSGHATQSLATFVALALVCAAWLPRARWTALVLAAVLAAGVGWSRVYLGVHWATDVVAGWLIAGVWIAIVAWLATLARSIEQRSSNAQT
jgi:undecaprenyl-diphosphatase